MNKSELLNWLHEEQQPREALLDQIGPERMEQLGVNGDWSMKDIVAHLTGWQPRVTAHLQAAQRGESEPPPWPAHLQTDDEINAWIYESNRGRSLREVLDEWRQVFQKLLSAVEGLPKDVRIEQVHQGHGFIILSGRTVSASNLVNSLTISMMTMSQTYGPGWRERKVSTSKN